MKKMKTIIALILAFAILGVFADDSAPFFLNTAKGTRIAKKTELISYSTDWDKGSSVRVTADGATLKEAVAPASGDVAWDGAKASLGLHTLTHVSGGKTLTAQFTVLGDDVVMHSGVIAVNKIWDTNKVHLVTGAITVPSGVSLTINSGAVVKFMPGMSISVISGGSCTASGAIFTHVNDDTIGGDTMMDEDSTEPKMGEYTIAGNVIDDDATEYRYSPPQTLTSNISSDTRLRGYRIYIVSNSVTVASGAKLTLQPGTILKFNSGCSLTVNGTLDAKGTRAAPIVFTSLKDDEHGGDTNADGDKTYARYNDWKYITVAGKASFEHVMMMYGGGASNTSESGMLIGQSGGEITINHCILAHALYDGIFSRATVTGENTIIYDCDRGVNTCGGTGVFKNCVVDSCRWGVMAEGGSGIYYNCIITRFFGSNAWPTGWGVAYWSGSLKTYNCCVWSTLSGASNYRSSPTTVDNISKNPLFVDPDNGDFRISADSPCVDAGNGDFAPGTDYYGQPRMDVKKIKDTGIANAEGVCPDIGIYEVLGTAAVPVPDLAVMSVSAPAELITGESIVVEYVVTNRGEAAVSGIVRDEVVFKSGGQEVSAGVVAASYSLASLGASSMSAQIRIPPLSKGEWRIGVRVNRHRDIFERNLSNNELQSVGTSLVRMDGLRFGASNLSLSPDEKVGFELLDMPLDGGYVRISGNSSAIGAAVGVGVVPILGGGGQSVLLPDGSQLLAVPPRSEGESAYVVVGNSNMRDEDIVVEIGEDSLKLYGVSPVRASNSGEATFVVTGVGLGDVSEIRLGGKVAKKIEVLGAMQIAATFDMTGIASGAQTISVIGAGSVVSSLESAVEIYAAKMGAKLKAWLEMPSSVRDGRVFTGYVCYRNEGDSPMAMPVFKVVCRDSNTKMGLVADENMTAKTLYVGGISPSHPAGVLKAGDESMIPFYFQPFGSYKIELLHIKEIDDMSAYPTFGGTKAYIEAMSAAATRLNMRGRSTYDVMDFERQALAEKNGIAHAAASGYLVDAKTGEKLSNTHISLVPADSSSQLPVSSATTDDTGYFQLTDLADGEYCWLTDSGTVLVGESTNSLKIAGQSDLNAITVHALPGGCISGFVLSDDGNPMTSGLVALLDANGVVVTASDIDGFGAFSFKNLCDGTYGVRSMPNGGYLSGTVTNLVIDALVRKAEANITVARGAILGGTVSFNGEAVTNGVVQAITGDGRSVKTLCGTNGVFCFNGIEPDDYAVRYYSNSLESDDVWVALKLGDEKKLDLTVAQRPLFEPTHTKDFGSCTTKFIFIDSARAKGITAWAWDFESDGVVDSTDPDPTWTYSKPGTNTVTLTIVEASGSTSSIYRNCVIVEEKVATILASDAIIFGENSGTLATESVGEDTLVLTGVPDSGTIVKGNVILGKIGDDWYCRRVVDVAKSGDIWNLTTIPATWDEVYEQCAISATGTGYVEEEPTGVRSVKTLNTSRTGSSKGRSFRLYAEGGIEASVSVNPSLHFEYERYKVNGKVRERYAYVGRLDLGAELGVHGTVGARMSKEFKTPFHIVIPTPVPGVTLENEWLAYIEGDAHIKGSASIGGEVNTLVRLGCEWESGKKPKWLKPFDASCEGHAHGDVEGSVSVKLGLRPEFKAKLAGTASAVLAVDGYVKAEIGASAKAPAEAGLSMGLDLIGELNLVDWNWKIIDFKLGISGTVEGPHRDILKWCAPDPDFDYSPKRNIQSPVTINFVDESEAAYWQFWNGKFSSEVTGYEWDLGNGLCSNLQNPSAYYAEKGTYTVSLKAKGNGINGPYRKKAKIKVGEKDEDGKEESDDSKQDSSKKSWDPNEVSGPAGFGPNRLVRSGEWMDYTVYFENKEGFDVADAQEVTVTNPLNEWLDWSTFEVREVAFNNHIDTGLSGVANGTHDKRLEGTDRYVRTTVSIDTDTGVAKWYMRIYDPNGMFGWPSDGSGFLPSNDATHRGEGYVSYRIKLRDDAPHGVVVTNSASIVFDYNEPIETDPAWWNTVGVPGAAFDKSEINVKEGENITFTVSGGAEDKVSSVKLYLTYNTAAAADVDLANGMAWNVGAAVHYQFGLKFPLTLTWAAGEIGEKTITIPIKADKAIEDAERFTLQLGDPVGMELGETRLCTVTITDPGYAEFEAKIAAGTATKAEKTAWDKLQKAKAPYIRGVADPANAGKVTGSGLCASGKKVTLKATANKGYVFTGWLKSQIALDGDRLVTNAVEYVATTPSLVIDRTAKPAKDTATSTTLTNVNENATFYAAFITTDEDKAAVGLTLNGGEVPQVEDNAPSLVTNIMCGVALNWPLASSALSATTVKVAGLPAGLKFTAKDIMKKGSKTEVEIPANTIYGAPTAASKIDKKTGLPVPSAVKVTVTTAGKSSVTYLLNITVDALPAWAVGNFEGFVRYDENDGGLATMSITAAGKVSGKIAYGGTNWTFKADSFAIASETVGYTNLAIRTVATSGKATLDLSLNMVDFLVDSLPSSTTSFAEGYFGEVYTMMHRLPWKDKGDADAAALIASYAGAYSCRVPYGDDSGDVTFVLDEKGAVKGTVVLPDGDKTRKATFSCNVLPNYDSLSVVIALPPDAKKGYPAVFKVVNLVNHSGEGADNLAFRDPGVVASVAELTAESGATGTVSVNPKYGQVAPGKDVTLTAKAAKGSVFHRWEITGVDTEGLDLSSATLKFKMTDAGDVFATALFATTQEDAASLALDLADAITETDGAFLLDLGACVSSLSLAKLTVAGLPTGLKYDAKTMTISGKATKPGLYAVKVTATNASATGKNAVVGQFTIEVPNFTAANGYFVDNLDNGVGKKRVLSVGITNIDDFLPSLALNSETAKLAVSGLPAGLKYDAKTGKITGVATKPGTYTVTLTVTDGKAKYVSTITVEVEALPDWVVGTFEGYAFVEMEDESDYHDRIIYTISSTGKVSSKGQVEDTTWYTIKDNILTKNVDGSYQITSSEYEWDFEEKRTIRIKSNVVDGVVIGYLSGIIEGAQYEEWSNSWINSYGNMDACQNVWKNAQGTKLAPAFAKNVSTVVDMSEMRDDDWDPYYGGYLTLKYGANGAVTTAYSESEGGKATATGSAQLVPYEVDGNITKAWLYTALKPKGRDPFGVLLLLSINTSKGNVYGDDVVVEDYLLEVDE